MKNILLLIFLIAFQNCFSQPGYLKVVGQSADDIFNDMEEMSDGGLLFGGSLQGIFNVSRCTQFADTIWTKQLLFGNILLNGISVLANNNFALSGWENNPDEDNAVVIITDSGGNFLNSKSFYPNGVWGVWGREVFSLPDSGLIFITYVDGYTCSNGYDIYRFDKNLGQVAVNSIGECDATAFFSRGLNKTSQLFQICRRQWFDIDSLGNDLHDIPTFWNNDLNFNTLSDSTYYIGKFINGVNGTHDSCVIGFGQHDTLGSKNIFIMKMNPDGTVAWTSTFGTHYNDSPVDVIETSDNGFAVLSTQLFPNNSTGRDIDFWKLDSLGQVVHHTEYGSTGNEKAIKMLRKNDNSLVILGNTNGFGSKVNLIIQLDSIGNLNTPYSVNTISSHYCQGDTAVLSVQPAGQSYLWSTGETTQSIQVTNTGNYEVTVFDSTGSHITPHSSVYFDTLPDATLQNASQATICEGQQFTLQVPYQQGNTYNWYRDGVYVDTVWLNTLNADTGGNYHVIVSNACGIDTSVTVSLIHHPNPAIPVIKASSLHECGPIYLFDSIPRNDTLHWRWQQNNVTADTLHLTAPQRYFLSVTAVDSNNCVSAPTSVVARIDSQPDVQFATSNMNICTPGNTTIPYTTSLNYGTFSLFRDNIITGTYTSRPTISANTTSIIKLIMTNLCGSDTDSISVTAIPKPQIAYFPVNPVLCSANPFVLTCTTPGVYLWSINGQTFTDSALQINSSGSVFLRVTDTITGCFSNSSVWISNSNAQFPLTNLLTEYIVCPGDTIELSPGTGFDYYWSNGSQDSTMTFLYNSQQDTSVITITIVDSSDCANTDTLSIISDLCLGINTSDNIHKIRCYPNPANEYMIIELMNYEFYSFPELKIFDMMGTEVVSRTFEKNKLTIDVSSFAASVYFIQIKSNNRIIESRFVVVD